MQIQITSLIPEQVAAVLFVFFSVMLAIILLGLVAVLVTIYRRNY